MNIPRATADKLSTDYPMGTRHQAKVDIAMGLLGANMSPTAVFIELRQKFPDAKESEIQDVIKWADSRVEKKTYGGNGNGGGRWKPLPPTKPKRTPLEQLTWWLDGFRMTPEEIKRVSPIQVPNDPVEGLSLAFATLWAENENLNIVCDYTLDEKKGKANPKGTGKTLTKQGWIDYFELDGIPCSNAGAWLRINPCKDTFSGDSGGCTDKDITAFRYMLVEFDSGTIDAQLAFYYKFKLPVAAMLLSGGKSAHAWVKVGAKNESEYDERVKRIHELLAPFGPDAANKNPSRLSRLPNATRKIQAQGDGVQRLLYLNPMVEALTDDGLKQFEQALAFPIVQDKPMAKLAEEARGRYEYMWANQDKLGVPIGIPQMDKITGGLKAGQTTVIAGVTGGCKSTLALHAICTALENNYGVLLFSLEMDKEEVFDLMVSRYTSVSRNKFNTGKFTELDFKAIAGVLPKMAGLPLFIEDRAMMTANEIRLRTMQLVSENRIKLCVVDYIQFVNPEWTKDNREQQVAQISHNLRALARESRIPMIILSQLNDEGLLRESRVIAHNANTVLMVEVQRNQPTQDDQNPNDTLKIAVKKGRGIPQGTLYMEFDRLHAKLIPERRQSDDDYGREPSDQDEESAQAATEPSLPYPDP